MSGDDSSKSEFPSNHSTGEGLHAYSSAQSKVDARKSSSTVPSNIFQHFGDNRWKFERILAGIPMNGTVRGDAQFDRLTENELLYKEQGKLRLSSMNSTDNELDVTQKYLYVYDSEKDLITSYFVENLFQRGSFFHQLCFDNKELAFEDSISARGEHLCGQDHYSVFYTFDFDGQTKILTHFQIKYLVKGPKKDYLSQTTFCRSH